LASAKDFGCANVLASAKDFEGAIISVSAKGFWMRQYFCIYFAAPIFLCIFLHSYLVFANNLIGANILRLLGYDCVIVVMIMYYVFHDYN
jgi:hypothetical protein